MTTYEADNSLFFLTMQEADNSYDSLGILHHLAALSSLDYERCRETEAERLGIRVSALDEEVELIRQANVTNHLLPPEPDPWEEPVNGAEILSEVSATLRRYVVLTDHQATAIALWIAHAHAHDAATISPRLSITSPVKRCGKSTLLSVVHNLVPRALSTSNITPAAVFRVIEAAKPTLLIDEAETFLRGNDDLRGILNGGHNRALARVIRISGEYLEPTVFDIWAPVAIALIGRLPATLADRSIEIELRRKTKDERCERLRSDRIDHLIILRRKLARWVRDHLDFLRNADPDVPQALHDRAADNWRPLVAIADEAGDPWPTLARTAALSLTRSDTDDAPGIRLLEDIRAIYMTTSKRTSGIFTKDLLQALHANDQRPWGNWTRGKPITPHQVSKLLSPFGIPLPRTIRLGHKTGKGYRFDDFTDAFSRYLPPLTVTQSQAADSLSSHDNLAVTVSQDAKPKYASETLVCDLVTDEDGPINGGSTKAAPSRAHGVGTQPCTTSTTNLNGNGPSPSKHPTLGNGAIAGTIVRPASVKARFGWLKRLLPHIAA